MASSAEHFVMPLTVEFHYDGPRDAVVVTTTTKAYMLLYLGRLDDAIEIPLTLEPADLSEFLQPPLALAEYELMPEIEPIPEPEPLSVYDPLLEFEPMSPNLAPLELVIPEVPIIEISSSNSPTPVVELHLASDSSESDPFEATSIAASQVSCYSSRRGRASRPH